MIIVEYTRRESPCDHRLSLLFPRYTSTLPPFRILVPRIVIIEFLPRPCSSPGLLRFLHILSLSLPPLPLLFSFFSFLFFYPVVRFKKPRDLLSGRQTGGPVSIRSRKHAHNGHLEEDQTRDSTRLTYRGG